MLLRSNQAESRVAVFYFESHFFSCPTTSNLYVQKHLSITENSGMPPPPRLQCQGILMKCVENNENWALKSSFRFSEIMVWCLFHITQSGICEMGKLV